MLPPLGRWLVPAVVLGSALSSGVSARSLATNGTKQGYCVIENGFDIRGNDLYEVAGSSAEVCCDECSKHYACSSWTWTNHNGGTCWLKGGRTRLEVNPNAKSALMFDAPPPVCEILDNVDSVGNDLSSASSPTAEGCCEICQNTLGCRVYSWNNVNGGTCWLKSNRVDAVVRKGVKSAYAYPHYGYDDVFR
ncbi:hypothetical protein Poli38472_008055 [Pythium oligandrum]|uniref:Apple domain-containing protein n=1 Tax=Pythium oligandrum TaxID=41045 RepID=A0A8K1FPA2_PYTOL|nr:hypothetical protein Poli38472_008055 [Pythium oligandrum]|eukprot:TMW65413.1 hypothetical protein Poli38472_008055 [Pythium oligandrum]